METQVTREDCPRGIPLNSSYVELGSRSLYRRVMTTLVDLIDVNDSMTGIVGGKAVHLGIMIAVRLPVPRGFCVTTYVFRLFTVMTLRPPRATQACAPVRSN